MTMSTIHFLRLFCNETHVLCQMTNSDRQSIMKSPNSLIKYVSRAGGRIVLTHISILLRPILTRIMSSTYAHYQGPSSLPSDYAILSRLSTNYESSTPEAQPENSLQIPRRRGSFPEERYYRPLNPTIGVYPRVDPHGGTPQHLAHSPTETSPLLNNLPVPRIEENRDGDTFADKASKLTMFQEELAILTKYALPVFGYA